jgi:hypothetical protein
VDAGIPEDSGPGSTQSSSRPGNTSSSSRLPPPPGRFLLRFPAGLLRPARPAPRVRPACGPASLGAPTQAHGSMKQKEKAEREKSRPSRPRLGQEKRWETRTAPRPPHPSPPGRASLGSPPAAPRACSRRGGRGNPGVHPWGAGQGSRGGLGEGLRPAAKEAGGALGRASQRRAGGRGAGRAGRAGRTGEGWTAAPGPGRETRLCSALSAARLLHSLQEAASGPGKVWWSPAPPGGPPLTVLPPPPPPGVWIPPPRLGPSCCTRRSVVSPLPRLPPSPAPLTRHLFFCVLRPSPSSPLSTQVSSFPCLTLHARAFSSSSFFFFSNPTLSPSFLIHPPLASRI